MLEMTRNGHIRIESISSMMSVKLCSGSFAIATGAPVGELVGTAIGLVAGKLVGPAVAEGPNELGELMAFGSWRVMQ